MVASSASISGANVVLNTIVAEALDEIATRLEKAKDINKECNAIVRETAKEHGRIIFNGNNYSSEWVAEAKKRGIPNITNTVDALKAMANKDAVRLFTKFKVLSEEELHSRYEIYLEHYIKSINIEARTSIDMTKTLFIPAGLTYASQLAQTIARLKDVKADAGVAENILENVSGLLSSIESKLDKLEAAVKKSHAINHAKEKAEAFRDHVFTAQAELRVDVDALETIMPKDLWPVPSYADMLFNW